MSARQIRYAETTRISTRATERDVILASDTDNDEPVVILTAETKNKIKNSIASSMVTKEERACLVCDVMIYGFDELLIESFPGIIMIYSNIRTFIILYAQNSYIHGRPTGFIKGVLYNSNRYFFLLQIKLL